MTTEDVRIRFTGQAQVRGRGYFPGNELQVDEATAAAYVRAGQAVRVPNEATAENEPPKVADARANRSARRKTATKRPAQRAAAKKGTPSTDDATENASDGQAGDV